jgi:hypothetical protein
VITQSLGGSYTIATYQGLARVAEKDLDALGLEKPQPQQTQKSAPPMAKFQRKTSGTNSGNVTIPRSPLTLLISVWSTIVA